MNSKLEINQAEDVPLGKVLLYLNNIQMNNISGWLQDV